MLKSGHFARLIRVPDGAGTAITAAIVTSW
jgi:hypothetical protein